MLLAVRLVMQVKHSRRRFLALLASVPFLGGFFALNENTGSAKKAQHVQTAFEFGPALERVTNPSLVGEKYLELCALEKKPVSAQYIQNEIDTITGTSPTLSIVEKLLVAIDEDFRTNNSLLIDGWIYSRTECSLCALIVLTGQAWV